MKEKLLKIRQNVSMSRTSFVKIGKQDSLDRLIANSSIRELDESLALIDELLATMDSPALVERVLSEMLDAADCHDAHAVTTKQAQAAINTIKDKV